jgi:hypothetical protein
VPTSSAQSVTESGQPVEHATGLKVLGLQDGYLAVEAGFGTYKFHSIN